MICNAQVTYKSTRALSANRQCLGILLSSLMLFEYADVKQMREAYAECGKQNKRLCEGHHARAAYFLIAEMEKFGALSRYKEPGARNGTVYVNEGDIPQEILDSLNATVKKLDLENVLTPRNLATFLNDALVRYFSGNEWYKGVACSKMPGYSDLSKSFKGRRRPARVIDTNNVRTLQLVGFLKVGMRPSSSMDDSTNTSSGEESVQRLPAAESESLFEHPFIKLEPCSDESKPVAKYADVKIEPSV
ncbi:hypothetical protein RB195_001604 [Necator americanus]|uniref:Uncharacterized protein n=1 Tax=Necator americanus TaxID=51031 RepID=A0ABR1DGJ6_NECAM